jgi:hypothetical protein
MDQHGTTTQKLWLMDSARETTLAKVRTHWGILSPRMMMTRGICQKGKSTLKVFAGCSESCRNGEYEK